MVLKPIDNAAISNEYKHMYDQTGGWVPVYIGSKYQKGHGLGSVFSGMLKSALPMIKKGAIGLAKTAAEAGLNIAKDGIEGKNIKNSLANNLKLAGSNLLQKSINYVASPRKTNKRKRPLTNSKPKKANKSKKPRLTQNKDIFS